MTALTKIAAVLAKSWLIGFAALSASAQTDVQHLVAADGSTTMLGRPASAPLQMVLTDKPLNLIWESGESDEEVSEIQVARITDTRRVMIASENVRKIDKRWSWNWAPPKTTALVRYEVRLKALPNAPVILEVYDAVWFERVRRAMMDMKWEAEGLTEDELVSLEQAGIHKVHNQPAHGSRGVRLQLTSTAPGNPRRIVTWDDENHHLVVWRPGPADGDFSIRAPRWWIGAEALSTDHGIIRLYLLLSAPPVNP